MVRNEEKYEQAVQLRKRGFTLTEIARYCDISKSTASNWLKNKDFSDAVTRENKARVGRDNAKRLKLMVKARGAERTARYREAIRTAETEFTHYKKDALFIAGLSVYAASGDVTHETQIRLSTNRLPVQRTFIQFAKTYLGVENADMRLWILLHEKHDETKCLKKWSRAIGVSPARFGRSQFIKNSGAPLHFGTLNTIIGSTVLKKKLDRWLELLEKTVKTNK